MQYREGENGAHSIEGCAKKTERTFYFIAFLLLKIMLLPLCVLKDGTLGILKWQIGSI